MASPAAVACVIVTAVAPAADTPADPASYGTGTELVEYVTRICPAPPAPELRAAAVLLYAPDPADPPVLVPFGAVPATPGPLLTPFGPAAPPVTAPPPVIPAPLLPFAPVPAPPAPPPLFALTVPAPPVPPSWWIELTDPVPGRPPAALLDCCVLPPLPPCATTVPKLVSAPSCPAALFAAIPPAPCAYANDCPGVTARVASSAYSPDPPPPPFHPMTAPVPPPDALPPQHCTRSVPVMPAGAIQFPEPVRAIAGTSIPGPAPPAAAPQRDQSAPSRRPRRPTATSESPCPCPPASGCRKGRCARRRP